MHMPHALSHTTLDSHFLVAMPEAFILVFVSAHVSHPSQSHVACYKRVGVKCETAAVLRVKQNEAERLLHVGNTLDWLNSQTHSNSLEYNTRSTIK